MREHKFFYWVITNGLETEYLNVVNDSHWLLETDIEKATKYESNLDGHAEIKKYYNEKGIMLKLIPIRIVYSKVEINV